MIITKDGIDFIALPFFSEDDKRKVSITIVDKESQLIIDSAAVEVIVVNGLEKNVVFDVISCVGKAQSIFNEKNVLIEMMSEIDKRVKMAGEEPGKVDYGEIDNKWQTIVIKDEDLKEGEK